MIRLWLARRTEVTEDDVSSRAVPNITSSSLIHNTVTSHDHSR